jgi:hypothetical protein
MKFEEHIQKNYGMKKLYVILLLISSILFTTTKSPAQNPTPYGFGGFPIVEEEHTDEPTESQRKAIVRKLQENVDKLGIKSPAKTSKNTENTSNFIFPLRQAAGYNDPGFYDIGNYIDRDPSPLLRDYMCGARTYNDHKGTDIGTFPFGWEKMKNNAVEVISATAGIIIGKSDENDDKSCSWCTSCNWNAVYIQNNDGTLCWYGHLKNGSLTKKAVGQPVAQGEYLGVVGSSGMSTAPHLHFEVWSDLQQMALIDPWDGSCNVLAEKTYWSSQLPYHNPMINKVMSSSGIPTPYGCYDQEKSLSQNQFNVGETVYLPFFVRDNIPGRTIHVKLTTPSGTTYAEWDISTGNTFYSNCWYYYYFDSLTTPGTWTFSVGYGSNVVQHSFSINSSLPVKLKTFSLSKLEKHPRLFWETTHERNADKFLIQRSNDANEFITIASIPVKSGTSDGSFTTYNYDDKLPQTGMIYYRLKMMDFDESFAYSHILSTVADADYSFIIRPNPVSETVYVQGVDIIHVELLDINGNVCLTETVSSTENITGKELNIRNLSRGLYILRATDSKGFKQAKKLVIQ